MLESRKVLEPSTSGQWTEPHQAQHPAGSPLRVCRRPLRDSHVSHVLLLLIPRILHGEPVEHFLLVGTLPAPSPQPAPTPQSRDSGLASPGASLQQCFQRTCLLYTSDAADEDISV